MPPWVIVTTLVIALDRAIADLIIDVCPRRLVTAISLTSASSDPGRPLTVLSKPESPMTFSCCTERTWFWFARVRHSAPDGVGRRNAGPGRSETESMRTPSPNDTELAGADATFVGIGVQRCCA